MLMTKLSVLVVTDDRLYDGFFLSLFLHYFGPSAVRRIPIDRSAPVSSAEL